MVESGARSFDNLFEYLPIHVPARLSYQHEFARWLPVCPELLDSNCLPVGVVGALEDVLVFSYGETLDDFGFGERWRRRRLRYISDARDVMLRWRTHRSITSRASEMYRSRRRLHRSPKPKSSSVSP